VTLDDQYRVAEAFTLITGQLLTTRDAHDTLQRIVSSAVEVIEGCDHAGISLLIDGRLETPAQSDEVPAVVAGIQDATGEGPCVDATYESRSVFETADLSRDDRWPRYAADVVERTDIHSAMGVRLTKNPSAALGALDLYATAVDAFDDTDRNVAAIYAAFASVAIRAALEREQLMEAIASRDLIGQAKGIIMARTGVDEDRAFAMLREASSRLNRKLRDVASGVVEHQSRPRAGSPPGPAADGD
jgi:transcriptional regulator with GAF, ATPase, and Fis domain